MESRINTNRKIDKVRIISNATAVIYVAGLEVKISVDDLSRQKYKRGMDLTDSDWQKLLLLSIGFIAKDYSLKLLTYGAKSQAEIIRRIGSKIRYWLSKNRLKVDNQIINDLVMNNLNFLKEKNFVDDKAYVDSLLRKYKDKSRKELFFILSGKGVDKDIIEGKLINFDDGERDAIRNIIARKIRRKDTFSETEKRKLLAGLYRKGFSIKLAKTEIDDLLKTK